MGNKFHLVCSNCVLCLKLY